MKYILLLRHAKSSHDDSGLKDFDRPLAPRGKKDAPRMGQFVSNIEFLPGVIISSTAKRAVQTTRLFAEAAGLDEDIIQWNRELYYGSTRDYLDTIRALDTECQNAMLVGHNPKIEDCLRLFCGNGSVQIPTGGLACLQQPANKWSQIQKGVASVKWMVTPKMLARLQL